MSKPTEFETVSIKDVPVSEELREAIAYRPVVLVVDDESVIADTIAEILTRKGYAAIPVYDAEEALETALVMPPELLLTDVVLPGMSGIELSIKIKRIFPDCKILLFSGQAATTEMLTSANQAGHRFDLLSKPIHPTDLLTHVASRLKPRRPQTAVSIS
jgi:DNA-binding NtrC family response regulator